MYITVLTMYIIYNNSVLNNIVVLITTKLMQYIVIYGCVLLHLISQQWEDIEIVVARIQQVSITAFERE